MKRLVLILGIAAGVMILGACTKEDRTDNMAIVSPTPAVTNTAGDNSKEPDQTNAKDYYPLKADTEYVYEGSGNEYASFLMYVDYLDEKNDRFQTRTNNGGTETVKVIEYKDGKLYVLQSVNECYYRENFLNAKVKKEDAEILLMEPITDGTRWLLPDGRMRFISSTDVMIETPSGKYNAIEVTTEGEDSVIKDYYAKGTGLVQSLFYSGDMEVSSALSKINQDKPLTREIEIYYPDSDGRLYAERLSLIFHTDDITRKIISEAMKTELPTASYLSLISKDTQINSLYLGKDNIAYVDFSSEFIADMNVGAGYEQLILQGIANTFGMYYGTDKVSLTVEGKPYESGHILMTKGETISVSMDNVVQE